MQEFVERFARNRRDSGANRFVAVTAIICSMLLLSAFLTACAGVDDNGTTEEGLATREARQNPPPTDGEASPTADGEEPSETPGTDGRDEELAAQGQQLAQAQGCTGCHSVDGSQLVGPTWQGLFGSEVTLESGETVTADEEYIHNSIVNPGDQIHQGFPPVMPNTYSSLSDDQLNSLVAYIKSLQ